MALDATSALRGRFAAIVPALVLALLTLRAAADPIGDVDVGWLVAAGRGILAEGAAPTRNGFSFVAPDHPWIMHEWLLGAAYALGWRAIGPLVFGAVCVLASVAVGWLVIDRSFARIRSPFVAAIWASVLFLYPFDRLRSARPIGVSLVLACALVTLSFRPKLTAWAVAACVFIELLWTNLHGSFPLGLLILALACLDAGSRRRHLVALGLASAVTMANPYGLRLFGLVASYASGAGEAVHLVHQRVLEFSPVWRVGYHDVVSPVELVLLALLTVVAIDALRASSGRGAAALALILCLAAFVQARNVALATLVGSLLVQPHVAKRLSSEPLAPPRRVRALLLAAPAAIAGIAALLWTARWRGADDWIDPSIGGAPFARLARRLPDRARVFVPFRSGGLLLLLSAERGVTTLYDARNDCYPSDVVRAALALKDGELPPEGLSAWLARYGTDYAIVPSEEHVRSVAGDPRWSALGVLEPALRAPGFHAVAADGGWVLMERDARDR